MKATKVLIQRPVEMKPVPGYEGRYSVTRGGRVWSHQRVMTRDRDGAVMTLKAKWLKPKIIGTRYPSVQLYHPRHLPNKYGHRCKTWPLHHLVMAAWGPPKPSKLHEINHVDSNKLNAHIDNLEWVTRRENMAHSLVNGRRLAGLSNLTRADVLAIRAQYTEFIKSLTSRFGVSDDAIADIVKRRSWRHV